MSSLVLPSSSGVCPCCGSSRLDTRLTSPDRFFGGSTEYTYAVCSDCQAACLLPHPDWSLEKAYPGDYEFFNECPPLTWQHKLFARYLFPHVPAHTKGRIVDMGTSTGLFVDYLASRGHDVLGVEMDGQAVRLAKEAGRNVIQGDWESTEFDDESLAVLVMNQVIEHLIMPPDEAFEKAHRMLEKDGRWIFRTPNSDSWGRRHYQNYWHPLEVPRHTVIYSPAAVHKLADQHGFEVEKIVFTGRHFDIQQSERYRQKDGKSRGCSGAFLWPVLGSPVSRVCSALMNTRGLGDGLEAYLRKV